MNKEIALKLVNNDSRALKFVSDWQDDADVVGVAISESYDYNEFKFASLRLRGDADFILKHLTRNSNDIFAHVSEKLLKDRKFILKCVKKNAHIIKYTFADDYEIVLEAVKINGYAIQHTPLKTCDEIVYCALSNTPCAIQYVDPKYQNDVEFLIKLCKVDATVYWYLTAENKAIKKLAILACESSYSWECVIPEHLKKDRDVIKSAIFHNAGVYPSLSNEITDDVDFVKELVMLNPNILQYVPNYSGDYDVSKITNQHILRRIIEEDPQADKVINYILRDGPRLSSKLFE